MNGLSSTTITRGVRIHVEPYYVAERSDPAHSQWFFAYRVTVANVGDEPVQLLSRHWVITDGDGNVEHVRGAGVVGEQPHLQPGEAFRYTSACPLPTSLGAMEGSFQMVTDDGDAFDACIEPFTLAEPGTLN